MAGLGIYHYGARFYSPKLGRFLSADSIVPNPFNPQDYNRFAYVRNNPVRYTDPSGHICVQNGGGVDDEFGIAGNCNGGEKANYKNPFPGGVPAVNKPGKPKVPKTPPVNPTVPATDPDLGEGNLPELSKDDDVSDTPTTTTPSSQTPELPGTEPPCENAEDCESDMVIIGYLLATNIVTDLIVVTAVIYLVSNPIGWITLAAIGILAVVSAPFFYETYNTIQHIIEINAWRNYYEKNP